MGDTEKYEPDGFFRGTIVLKCKCCGHTYRTRITQRQWIKAPQHTVDRWLRGELNELERVNA